MELPIETLYAYPNACNVDINNANFKVKAHWQNTAYSLENKSRASIYVHVPFCLNFCHFCGFVKAKYRKEDAENYVRSLVTEINVVSQHISSAIYVDSIYIGGGSPSTLSISQVCQIIDAIFEKFDVLKDVELTFEGETLTLNRSGYLEALSKIGFTRLSFGVQILHSGARQALNLKPNLKSLSRLAEQSSSLFEDVAADYIFAWPGIKTEKQLEDLTLLIRNVKVKTYEFFRFEPLDASPSLMASFEAKNLHTPNFQTYSEIYNACAELTVNSGYFQKSYTLFSKLPSETRSVSLRYYSHYYGWDRGNVIGFGVGAQSFYRGLMWGAVDDLKAYVERTSNRSLPYDSINTYNPEEKELITWPRRGWISKQFVSAYANPFYIEKLKAKISVGIIKESEDYYELGTGKWAFVPVLMHEFLSPDQKESYDISSMKKANQRAVRSVAE